MRRRSCLGRGLRFLLLALLVIALGPSLINLPRAWVACRVWDAPGPREPFTEDTAIRQIIRGIPDYYRPEDKTYLTLPEWYIVYSTDEYGTFLRENRSSDFPYFAAVEQYWHSYREACDVVRGNYPFNGDSQFTLAFIGISFTAENMLKGAYEKTIGRVAQWTAPQPTEEEIYAARVAQEYGEFMHMTPWYFFPFKEKLQGLWRQTSLWGPDPVRKWERKLALTLEYG
ncbi:MAG TPA: hypothetical protein VK900_16545, partial [Anaerolineales bacterium]|nr:hypothetical protein [Anaerolineales bacterium]